MNKNFYIYGAGIVATGIYTAMKTLHNLLPIAFLVSEEEKNPVQIDGIPVKEVSEKVICDRSALFFVAVPEVHHKAIAESLSEYGIPKEQIVLVDNQLENNLMEQYYRSLPDFATVDEFLEKENKRKLVSLSEIKVFQAKCHVDKPLNSSIPMPEYVCPIQVGAAFTEKKIAEVRDNEGENISAKNRNYCELTATYYAWKNSQSSYKGLCHYRRIFGVQSEHLQRLLAENGDIDVILPYPSVHYPDVSGQHKRYIKEEDWDAMLLAMKEVAPAYYSAFSTVFSEQYFYNYNMLIAKRKVFDDYCSFLFSVLERTEELVNPKGWERADRFAGYLAENLTTLYFRVNRKKLKIVHTGKIWIA